ncbi:uncharacterized protein PHACADRAFT_252403 [Phanerochaete carnosa HHB-10118-sp]|uniref:RNB domain-containing protein n=1 Tax=Phanerochaete carnosa (strain HHB-10118-sp) TaxID=650164 RepID=K5X5V4_PHACS|nr:uncharacterized protein PHACADRAFT_252403 [Phanerochaete carnosa HHB-10118-sp]EKM58232.1 hypothetical protein PHACADRAFT_252403 [Phanerochaete carnosa HHB-10118-sp]
MLSQQVGNDRTILSLLSTGEAWVHLPEDVMFAVPGLVDRPTIMRAYDPQKEEEEQLPPKTIAARVAVLKKIRALEKEVETNYQSVSMKIHRILEDAPWANSEDWQEITTAEILRTIGDKDVLVQLCVHKFLMANHDRFIAQTSSFLETQKFWVRPRQPLGDLEAVSRMLAVSDPALDGFYKKAKTLVATSRMDQTSSSSPAGRANISITFTSEEQAIIRVLHDFVRSTRSTQKDPYVVPVATVMKRMGLSEGKVDQAVVHKLLIEMGVVAPWDDPVTRERALLCVPSRTSIPAPSTSTSSGASLSPEEFYPRDIVEHVRHDFKDLPAFVIDDEGAQELDDALSIESIPSEPGSYWLHVHVADPTLKIHPNHTLARQARIQYTTSYDIHSTTPMIPSAFMYDGLSLGTNSRNGLSENVLTFSCKVNELGDITDYKVRAGLLRNVHVLQYNQVDKLLGLPARSQFLPFARKANLESRLVTPSLAPAQVEELRTLYNISLKFVANRFLSNRFWFSAPTVKVTMDSKPSPPNSTDLTHPNIFEGFPQLTYEVGEQAYDEIGARRMVAEAMKAACRVASRFCRDHNIPAVRRTSTAPDATDEALADVLSLRDPDTYIPYEDIMKKKVGFPQGDNQVSTKGHWVMGVPDGEGYLRVTSPLRRYADLVSHWQIKHALAADGTPVQPLFSHDWMTEFAKEMTTKEVALRALERRHHLFWALKYIDRWRADPRNLAEGPNPFDNLEGIAIRESSADATLRRNTVRVIIPQLGVRAMLELRGADEYARRPMLGFRVPVKFLGLTLGTKPELGVTLRDV